MPSQPRTAVASRTAYRTGVDQALEACRAYYAGHDQTLSDAAYDQLMAELAEYEHDHPDHVVPRSPVGKVAGGIGPSGESAAHTVPMLSLHNARSAGELADWAAGLDKRLGRPVTTWTVEPKLDGMAVAARYRDGRLVALLTRGDGTSGEVVSQAIGSIDGLPTRLATAATFEVRGEVVFTRAQFARASDIRAAHGASRLANPRNAVAGTLRARNRDYTLRSTFYGFTLVDDASPTPLDQSRELERIAALGINTAAGTSAAPETVHSLQEVQRRIDRIAELRDELEFWIDGVVVKADLGQDRQDAGEGSNYPRWAVAYKFQSPEATTKLLDVVFEVGRTGHVAPRAVLAPVVLDGSTISSATLHNPAALRRAGVLIGDTVVVCKAGDIIPEVVRPVVEDRTGDEQPIKFPTTCPKCDGALDTSKERWRCLRGRKCGVVASLLYAVGRDQLDVEGLGRHLIVQLVDRGLTGDVGDLFALSREQFLDLEPRSPAITDKILAELAKARRQPFHRVLCALGVEMTGRSMSRRLARQFGSFAAIAAASEQELMQVDGIGREKARAIRKEMQALAPVIGKLAAAGVTVADTTPSDSAPPQPLAGLVVVVSGGMRGRLAGLNRTEVDELIERAGGKASSSVSRRTALLVAGDGAGGKVAKAQSLGIPVVTPEEFADQVADLIA